MAKKRKPLISETDVRHVAQLAKLYLRPGEIEKFRDQLSNIFEYVNQVGEMKTVGVSESSQVTGITNRFREDKVDKSRMFSQNQALTSAKKKHQGYIVAKAIFD